jgi:multiple sugar transport system permease protein
MEESPMLNLKKSKGNILTRNQRNTRNALVMVLPAILFLALLIAYPLGKVIHDSFFFTNLINKAITGFAGVQNFQKVISDEHFSQAVTNTCLWTFFSVLGEYILGMLTGCFAQPKV